MAFASVYRHQVTACKQPHWHKGRREKIRMAKVAFAAAPKTKAVTCFVIAYCLLLFYYFALVFFSSSWALGKTRGVKKRLNKNPPGLITKTWLFSPSCFCFPSLGCFTRFFLDRVFLGVRNKGSSQTRSRKSRGAFRSRKKKLLTFTSLASLFFLRRPLALGPWP
jgi:hypothetical protein